MSGGSQVPQAYQPSGQKSADIGYQNITGSMAPFAQSLPGYVIPQLQRYTQAQLNNPFAAQAMSGAQQGGAQATGTLAPAAFSGAQTLYGMGQQYSPYGAQVLAQGFDPQNELYNRNYQRTMDQQNAINAQNGIAGTPYGAGVAGQTGANFNLDWNQQALNREATAAATAGNIAGETSNLFGAGANLGNTGLQQLNYGSMLPYSTYGAINQNYANALNQYSQGVSGALAPGAGVAGLYGNYLGIGQQATGLNQQAAQQQAQQDASMWGGIGNIVGGAFGAATNPLSLFGASLWG